MCSSSLSPPRQQHEKACVNRLNRAVGASHRTKCIVQDRVKRHLSISLYMEFVRRQKGMTYANVRMWYIRRNVRHGRRACTSHLRLYFKASGLSNKDYYHPQIQIWHGGKAIINRGEMLKSTCLPCLSYCCPGLLPYCTL